MDRNSHGNVSDRFGSLQLCCHVKHETWDPGISRVKGRVVSGFRCGSAAQRAHMLSPTESSPTGAVLQALGHFIISCQHLSVVVPTQGACVSCSVFVFNSVIPHNTHVHAHNTHAHTRKHTAHTCTHAHSWGKFPCTVYTGETAARPHGNMCSRLLFLFPGTATWAV